MTITGTNVVYIDVNEGPNLEGLLRGIIPANSLRSPYEHFPNYWLLFKKATFFDKTGTRLVEVNGGQKYFRGNLVRFGYVDNIHVPGSVLFDIVISTDLGAFGGRYNTHSRKGMLWLLK
jgi:hypothetical protein